ncbi:MAG TPA: HAMP domain-containing sensor histidine kinase [Polyangia bacterium]|nr:HAMP domain-containing sensor histidine kinase [Polyangia bacterium]
MRLAPTTLRGRLAAWYAAVLALTLISFAAAVYFFVADDDEADQCVPANLCTLVDPPEHIGRRVGIAVAIALPGALAVAIGGGFWVTRKSLKPIDDIARLAGELGAETLDRRVALAPDAADELVALGEVLNRMLDRIDRSVHGMRRFTADASHELRTPLAALRGELEVTLRRPRNGDELRASCESALEEVERLSELVELLLTLARSDAGELPLSRRPIRVHETVQRVIAPYEPVAADRGIVLECAGDAALELSTDPAWLERALVNLVDNACKFTPRGGRVRVETQPCDGGVRIVVSDSGPGVSADDGVHLFERFFRGTRARATPGFGLGLALASDVVRALGGTLAAGPSALGGAAFTVELRA